MESDRSPGIEVSLGEPVFVPVTLVPREVMHGAADQPLADRVSLAPPRVVSLNPDEVRTVAGDLISLYVSGHADSHRFCLLHIDLSFLHIPAEPILQASLNIQLFNDPPNGHPDPVAIAMIPEIAVHPTKHLANIKLKTGLQLVDAEIEKGVEYDGGDPYLQAHKPGRSDPAWFFTRTKVQNLAGPQPLLMVVAAPAEGHCKALVDLSANIRQRRALVGYEAQMPADCRLVELV